MLRAFLILLTGAVLQDALACRGEECKDLLMKAFEQMKRVEHNTFFMEYQVTTTYADSERDRGMASIHIVGNKSKFVSDATELYADESMLVAIMNDERSVYMMSAGDRKALQKQMMAMSVLQDSLLSKLVVIDCETQCHEQDDKWFIDKIEMQLGTKELQEESGIRKVTYWVDRKNAQITRVRLEYQSHPFDVAELDIAIMKYDLNYKTEPFKGGAYNVVYLDNGIVQTKYRGYELNDHR